jgi:hypothetical protein
MDRIHLATRVFFIGVAGIYVMKTAAIVPPPCGPLLGQDRSAQSVSEGLMDDTKQKEEQNGPKKPVGEQVTDLVAAAAGALAETAVQSVAKRVRKAAAAKTPKPVKKAVSSISKAAPKRTAERRAKKIVQRTRKSTARNELHPVRLTPA